MFILNATRNVLYCRSLFVSDRIQNRHIHDILCLFLCAIRCFWQHILNRIYCGLLCWLDVCVVQICMLLFWPDLHVNLTLSTNHSLCPSVPTKWSAHAYTQNYARIHRESPEDAHACAQQRTITTNFADQWLRHSETQNNS